MVVAGVMAVVTDVMDHSHQRSTDHCYILDGSEVAEGGLDRLGVTTAARSHSKRSSPSPVDSTDLEERLEVDDADHAGFFGFPHVVH